MEGLNRLPLSVPVSVLPLTDRLRKRVKLGIKARGISCDEVPGPGGIRRDFQLARDVRVHHGYLWPDATMLLSNVDLTKRADGEINAVLPRLIFCNKTRNTL